MAAKNFQTLKIHTDMNSYPLRTLETLGDSWLQGA
jgi:hypothetical protein